MRTIKYRGKDVKTGEWKYGHLINLNVNDKTAYLIITDDYAVVDKELKPWEIAFFLNVDIFMVDPNTVGQFTGLCDKNGKEIYEGDIVKTKGNWGGLVTWNNRGYFYINQYYNSDIGREPDCSSLGYMLTVTELYVIGNVYDNEDLLKKE